MIRIVPLDREDWDRFAQDFSRVPTFNWCWCQYWRMRSKDFGAKRVPELRDRLRALAQGVRSPGLVAFRGERAVGWVSVAPRDEFERLERSRTIPRIDDAPVWSIVCFAVSRTSRGEGLAAALLDAAVEWAREHGAQAIEAYPVDVPAGVPISTDAVFTGTRPMFERAGFVVVSATQSSAGGYPRVVARRVLGTSC